MAVAQLLVILRNMVANGMEFTEVKGRARHRTDFAGGNQPRRHWREGIRAEFQLMVKNIASALPL